MLDVCLLGTGGLMPLPDRWLTALLLRHNGRLLLIDCGEGTQIPFKMAGWGFKSLDAILLTHYHADHCAGLPGLLLTLGNSGRDEPLMIAGPPGLKEVLTGLLVVCPELPFEVRYLELEADKPSEIQLNSFKISSLPLDHAIPCLAYSVEINRRGKFLPEKARGLSIPQNYWKTLQKGESISLDGRTISPDDVLGEPRRGIKLCYCTDTRPVSDLRHFIAKSDLFICEGMYGNDENLPKAIEKKHMTFTEAAELAGDGDAGELWLTHYSPSLTNPEEYLDNVQKVFSNAITGSDLMKKTLNFSRD